MRSIFNGSDLIELLLTQVHADTCEDMHAGTISISFTGPREMSPAGPGPARR